MSPLTELRPIYRGGERGGVPPAFTLKYEEDTNCSESLSDQTLEIEAYRERKRNAVTDIKRKLKSRHKISSMQANRLQSC